MRTFCRNSLAIKGLCAIASIRIDMKKMVENSSQPPQVSSVEVFDFESCRKYLKVELETRRLRRRGYSLRQLAKKAKFSSPSNLSMFLSGHRPLSDEAAQQLAQALNLTGRRRNYFLILGKLDSTKSEEQKKIYKDQLMQIKGAVDESVLDVQQYRLLTEWHYLVIYVMVGQKNFKEDPEWIRKKLRAPLEVQKIEWAIRDLEALGLIEKKRGRWRQVSGPITTAEHIKDTALFTYHRKMSDMAKAALEQPSDIREFNGGTVAIPKDQMPWVKEKIRQLRKELNEHLSQFDSPSDVYQFNLQLFALTQGLENNEND